MQGTRILVVDNASIMLEYVRELLQAQGHAVSTADDGLAALRIIDSVRPDILITDLIMPYVDGLKLTRVLRARPEYENLFIVALSAIAKEERIDFRSHGIDVLIAKGPVREMGPHILRSVELWKQTVERGATERPTEILGLDAVHERKITAELLSELRRLRAVADNLSDGVVMVSAQNEIVAANRQAVKLLHEEEIALVGRKLRDDLWEKVGTGAHPTTLPPVDGAADGWTMYRIFGRSVLVLAVPVRDALQETSVVILRDVTEHITATEAMRDALFERNLLLEEVNHRMKNNMQTIASLINLRIAELPEGEARQLFGSLSAQVNAVGLVHERIFQERGHAGIEFEIYVRELLKSIIDFHAHDREVAVRVEAEPLELRSNIAVPIGLIVAELATNTFKHGLMPGTVGAIRITMKRTGGDDWLLTYEDSGVGIDGDGSDVNAWLQGRPHAGDESSLGMRIIHRLALQLRGKIRLAQPKPARFELELRVSSQ